MPTQSLWERTKTTSKYGFDKVYALVDKLGPPVNKLSNKLGSEAFWPTTLDKESDKAARILRSFCKDGFYEEEAIPSTDGPKVKQKVIKKIPAQVIRDAKGLAIFTTMRTGLWFSGAGGSGILVARKEDGTWSPPSGIMLHTAGLGFLVGVDIYDCVVVINTQKALDAFSTIRCTLGGEVSAVAGPVGIGGVLETEVHKRQAPVFTYLKSRGFYAGVQIDGTVIIERTDENERFYGQRIPVRDILAGKVRHPPYEIRGLMETIKAAQGDKDVDERLLPAEPPPGDFEIEDTGGEPLFGVPDKEDPDPYGVHALEKEGYGIREAGTGERASIEVFEFKPSQTSPIYKTYAEGGKRRSWDSAGASGRSSWRNSALSTTTADTSTQTDFDAGSPVMLQQPSKRGSGESVGVMDGIPEGRSTDDDGASKVNGDKIHLEDHENENTRPSIDSTRDEADTDSDDEPIVHEVQQAAAPQVISRARLVAIRRQTPPILPPRNPGRTRNSAGPIIVNAAPANSEDAVIVESPVGTLRSSLEHLRRRSSHSSDGSKTHVGSENSMNEGFEKVELNGVDAPKQHVKGESDEFHSLPVTPREEEGQFWRVR